MMHRSVSNGGELEAVLSDITASVAPCSFELSEPPRGGAEYVRVTIDDTDYALGAEWTLEDTQTVALNEDGVACGVLATAAPTMFSFKWSVSPSS